jgi:hypothetical protein
MCPTTNKQTKEIKMYVVYLIDEKNKRRVSTTINKACYIKAEREALEGALEKWPNGDWKVHKSRSIREIFAPDSPQTS